MVNSDLITKTNKTIFFFLFIIVLFYLKLSIINAERLANVGDTTNFAYTGNVQT